MGLFSNFTRSRENSSMAPTQSGSADTVQQARAKARHRLIGAVVLLLAGIVGFPLVFETQPRPTPVDIAIEIPRKDNAPPLIAPAPRALPSPAVPASAVVGGGAVSPSGPAAPAKSSGAVEPALDASNAPAAKVSVPLQANVPAPGQTPKAAATAKPKAEAAPPAQGLKQPPAASAAKPDSADGRFVVQVGAFADSAAAQVMRARAEKLGLKTYTQVVDTAAGNRVRVRIGPFASREAAEQVLAKAKAGGLSAVVLTL